MKVEISIRPNSLALLATLLLAYLFYGPNKARKAPALPPMPKPLPIPHKAPKAVNAPSAAVQILRPGELDDDEMNAQMLAANPDFETFEEYQTRVTIRTKEFFDALQKHRNN